MRGQGTWSVGRCGEGAFSPTSSLPYSLPALPLSPFTSAMFEHSALHVEEIYALANVVFYIAVNGPYKQ